MQSTCRSATDQRRRDSACPRNRRAQHLRTGDRIQGTAPRSCTARMSTNATSHRMRSPRRDGPAGLPLAHAICARTLSINRVLCWARRGASSSMTPTRSSIGGWGRTRTSASP